MIPDFVTGVKVNLKDKSVALKHFVWVEAKISYQNISWKDPQIKKMVKALGDIRDNSKEECAKRGVTTLLFVTGHDSEITRGLIEEATSAGILILQR